MTEVPEGAEHPFDPGLQPERTLLAWQRTVLALAVAVAAGVRFAAPLVGVVAVFFGAAGLALALAAYIGVRYRYRRVHAELRDSATLASRGAWPFAALAAATCALGLLAVLCVVGRVVTA
ncbi:MULTISPECIES: DUF202 domain-containing protein [Cryobacterium]|uniref:DUF202 domain-containing protein n=1 Tax=Cryobacterium TaxID=69578 RepID=UPI0015811955|nr:MULTISPECIES: DUF202 domain-containing protein [Cryobacterium]MDY7526906.1 DUF202 domain-containing protein [Cryobacterium sp. 10C2]MEB0002553.1 DUF202 domain-containing protein [Cryobacterium sp. RTC2.1]MEB0202439.1 DUF202 domain-containing protein [Cryobacterium sp. 5I3]MEB0286533.1 DUF202 domain-containing protein [Cryobacterium sp. 10S3]MEB0290407.1 DUF202 domain-containing protein [Cryobacterium sp. 10C2]